MEIRFAVPDDDPYEISSVYEHSWKFAYKDIIPQSYLDSIPHGRWANSIYKEGMNNLVVTDNGRIVGTSCFCRSRWKAFGDRGEIVSIYLLPEYMGKGVGGQLLQRCIRELNGIGFDKILLWVLEENTRARSFYEKHGFVCSEEYLTDNIGGKELREVMYTFG